MAVVGGVWAVHGRCGGSSVVHECVRGVPWMVGACEGGLCRAWSVRDRECHECCVGGGPCRSWLVHEGKCGAWAGPCRTWTVRRGGGAAMHDLFGWGGGHAWLERARACRALLRRGGQASPCIAGVRWAVQCVARAWGDVLCSMRGWCMRGTCRAWLVCARGAIPCMAGVGGAGPCMDGA